MMQNHLFQTLALVIMRRPENLAPESIRRAKTEALQSFVLDRDLASHVIFGQYVGYREEKDVAPDSRTETFVAMRLQSCLPEWQ